MDEILFFMENQDGKFALDCNEVCIVEVKNTGDENRYIALPQWDSRNGYRLMEKFASSVKNPVVRNELSIALNKNKGVFRAYRDILEQYPETEKMWQQFKKQKMKNEIVCWYNALREEWGLEPVGVEPEDTSSLVLEDFVIRNDDNEYCFIAESSSSEIIGRIASKREGSILHIDTLEVKMEFRGLGLGKTLLSALLKKADEQKLDLTIELPCDYDYFSRSLYLEEFKPSAVKFTRKALNSVS